MCAYKLVTCEFDYWPFQHKVRDLSTFDDRAFSLCVPQIEEFMHSYERSIFLNANRSMFW